MQSQKIDLNVQSEMKRFVVKRSRRQRWLSATLAAIGAVMAEATVLSIQAASLTNWSFDPAANRLEITVKDGTTPRYFLMAQPARIVLDLPGTAVGSVSAQQTYTGAVRQIRVSQFEPGLTRIVMEISPGVSLAPGQVKLQKVGNITSPSGNARWVLQPLITTSLSANVSANAVRVNSSASTLSRPTVSPPAVRPPLAGAAKPLATKPATPSKPALSQAASGENASSKPADTAVPSSSSGLAATKRRNDRSSTVSVPDLAPAPGAIASPPSAVPPASPTTASSQTQSTALAPVLPSPPAAQATTPPAPAAPTPVDPTVAVDTQRGVAITVPSPTARSMTSEMSPPTLAAIPQPINAQATARVEPSRDIPLIAKSPAPTTPAIARRSTNPLLVQPPGVATPARSTVAEIPTTLAAAPAPLSPSVSVPPLNAVSVPPVSPGTSTAQTRDTSISQPDPASVIPPSGFPTVGAQPTQPIVSVPPPIQFGTPNLGPANSAPPAEAAPISVFAPNASIEAPVSVPPLQPTPPLQPLANPTVAPIQSAQTSYDANTIRQSTSSANLAPPLNVVPLQPSRQQAAPLPTVAPGYDANTIRQLPTEAAPTSIVEFGQPLPVKDRYVRPSPALNGLTASQGVRQAFKPTAPDVLLPAGTVLNLRYPGDATLILQTDRPQQEVLVLLTELRDAAGNLLAPAGSAVTGRFETTTSGSQFVTQAIAVAGRTIPLTAQSGTLDGSRKVQGNNLAVNSGIGLVAGGVLGAVSGSAGLGALGGAAAGAAATLITAPKPAAIQPGQVVQVRLTQDLRRFE